MQSAHCLPPEACGGLGQYSDYVTVAAGHQDHLSAAYSAPHHVATDFPTPMYVNTMWGAADQAQVHHQPAGVYYDAYPPPMYSGYPGHMVQGSGGHQDGGIHSGYGGGLSSGSSSPQDGSQLGPGGKRKRRRVITFEQRKAANVRERKRMCHLNDAFDVLRKRVPTFAYEKKLSRIETLKLAVTYIQYMAELLEDLDDSGTSSPKSKKSTASSQQDSHNQSGGDISVHGGDASVTATSSPQSYSNRSDSPASKGNSPINVLEGGHDTIDSISDSRATGLQLGRLVVGTASDSASATAELMVSSQTSEVSLGNEEAELDIGGGVEAAASPIH